MNSQKPKGKLFDSFIQKGKSTRVVHNIHHIYHKRLRPKNRWEQFVAWVKHHGQLIFWAGLTIGVILLGAFFIWIATLKIPTLDNFAERKVSSSTKIYDKTGEVVLYDVHENIKRTAVPGDTIDLKIKNAVIAIEDKDFYKHHGIKISSIIRAFIVNITPLNGTQGGSTITQQVIKNTLLNSDRRISRKVKEWILALKLERNMGKEQILSIYLNEAPYGGSIYGVEEAARTFFGKSSHEITLAEAAYLAAIPNAPTYYSPYGKNKDKLDNRKNAVLEKMKEQGMITADEYQTAKDEVIVFKPLSDSSGKALHFVDYIRAYLEENYEKDALLVDGLKVTTTLDWKIQEQAEKIIKENALKNEKDWNASNSALVAIDPKTGQILAMVGSRDYTDTTIDGQFNVATAKRQPGSAFKPIIYARAFEKGFRPETTIFDVLIQFSPSCGAFSREGTDKGC
jgi:membrane peptidoglycan carboxypeptidase